MASQLHRYAIHTHTRCEAENYKFTNEYSLPKPHNSNCVLNCCKGQIVFGLELNDMSVPKLTHYGGTVLTIIVIYAMMPLPLAWCAFCAILSSLVDLALGIVYHSAFSSLDSFRMVNECFA